MKTCKTLFSGLFSALLLSMGLVGCQDYSIPEANTSLSYPAGETAVGAKTYTSAHPSVRSASTPSFAVTGVSYNGQAADASIASIDAATGIITMAPAPEFTAAGLYSVSVRVNSQEGTADYTDAFRLYVKGLVFTPGVTTRGKSSTFQVKENYLAQQEGTVFKLVPPLNDVNDDYKHFSIDTLSCAVTVDDKIEAGVYPISIKATNNTNPAGTTFADVLTVTVESAPYNLAYSPDAVTLLVKEGHTSPRPTLRGATAEKGTQTTFSLKDNHTYFTINAETGAISLAKGQVLATTEAKTFAFDVIAVNSLGSATFANAYSITVDPAKQAVPVTYVTYPDAFPVALKPGQAWTSGTPSTDGSAVELVYSLVGAPKGVTIDAETGMISFDKDHYMPLKTSDNKLSVQAVNIAMTNPYQTTVGDFSIPAPEALWTVKYFTNYPADAVIKSGVDNMDRYSFMGKIQNNQNTDKPATTTVVKNAFGRAGNPVADFIDYIGVNNKSTWAGNTNQNNDWMVSTELTLPSEVDTFLSPYVIFDISFQYGTDAQNILEIYAIEIGPNIYTKGEQDQDTKGLSATPSDLAWVAIATTDKTNAAIPSKITLGSSGLAVWKANAADLKAFKGKKIRFALRAYNPTAADSNSRTYRINKLSVGQDLPKD